MTSRYRALGKTRAALAPLCLAALLLSCDAGRNGGAEKHEATRPPDLFVILLDSLRADAMERVVDGQAVMPRLSSWASRQIVFDKAQAPSPSTPTSVSAMLASLPVPAFDGEFRRGVPDGVPVVPEALAAAGYRTAGYSANPNCARRLGHARGFATFVEAFADAKLATGKKIHPDHPARIVEPDVLLDLALAEAERETVRPVFAYVHLLQPHVPYEPPDEHVRLFVPEGTEKVPLDGASLIARDKKGEVPPEWLPVLRRHYDAHAHYADERLGRFLEKLDRHPRFARAFVAVISDHGEAFGEHGRILHNSSVFEEMIRIPMILKPPGAGGEPRRVAAPVDLIDLGPTLLRLAGASVPVTFQGRDLFEIAAAPEAVATRPLLSRRVVGFPAFSLRVGTLKLMRAWVGVQWREAVFDLEKDPGERYDASSNDAALRRRLSDLLGAELRRLEGLGITPAPLGTVEAEELEVLRSLGYADLDEKAPGDGPE